MAVIEIKDLSFNYASADIAAIKNINLEVERGEFILLCGESGCGKSTLLRLIKKQLMPEGKMSGSICYNDINIAELNDEIAAFDIGFVMQNPENQIVSDKVYSELAFALESQGLASDEIKRRVAEICGYFGIGELYNRKTYELSGGQKQLINLAAVMVASPNVLILDEPTSQLDPIAASEFIQTIYKINRDLGLTVIMSEHRLEEVFSLADRVAVMECGKLIHCDTPLKVAQGFVRATEQVRIGEGFPTATRLARKLKVENHCPLTVKEGKDFLRKNYCCDIKKLQEEGQDICKKEIAIEIKNTYFRYEKNTEDVVSDLNLKVYRGEVLSLVGGNGAGKTTALGIMSALNKPYRGSVKVGGRRISDYKGSELYRGNLCYLPQNPASVFSFDTVYHELQETAKILYGEAEAKVEISKIIYRLEIDKVLSSHPYDISGGQQQKVAIAKLLLLQPKIILLDEPTKGMDAYSKMTFKKILGELKLDGRTVVIVTHDIEFAAENSTRCGMFFNGQVVSIDTPQKFFSGNNFYTTAANKISRAYFENAVTLDELFKLCMLNCKKN